MEVEKKKCILQSVLAHDLRLVFILNKDDEKIEYHFINYTFINKESAIVFCCQYTSHLNDVLKLFGIKINTDLLLEYMLTPNNEFIKGFTLDKVYVYPKEWYPCFNYDTKALDIIKQNKNSIIASSEKIDKENIDKERKKKEEEQERIRQQILRKEQEREQERIRLETLRRNMEFQRTFTQQQAIINSEAMLQHIQRLLQ